MHKMFGLPFARIDVLHASVRVKTKEVVSDCQRFLVP